jgi:hypothetical protein
MAIAFLEFVISPLSEAHGKKSTLHQKSRFLTAKAGSE